MNHRERQRSGFSFAPTTSRLTRGQMTRETNGWLGGCSPGAVCKPPSTLLLQESFQNQQQEPREVSTRMFGTVGNDTLLHKRHPDVCSLGGGLSRIFSLQCSQGSLRSLPVAAHLDNLQIFTALDKVPFGLEAKDSQESIFPGPRWPFSREQRYRVERHSVPEPGAST